MSGTAALLVSVPCTCTICVALTLGCGSFAWSVACIAQSKGCRSCVQDADMVGVEGVSDPGSTWEGLGTISLGR